MGASQFSRTEFALMEIVMKRAIFAVVFASQRRARPPPPMTPSPV